MRPLARVLALALSLAPVAPAQMPALTTWRLQGPELIAEPAASDRPLPVGSLQKPFVAMAWARAHPDRPSPTFTCRPGSACWFRAGHGPLGLTRALAVSCNAYFLALARDTPAAGLQTTLAEEGFAPAPQDAEDAIGLAGNLSIRPSACLEAYRRLALAPWSSGEALRAEVLAGLGDAARAGGTASGLGHRGFLAKTGTVPSPDGDPLLTCGLAVAVDPSGWAILGRLRPGTGRQTATALAASLDRLRPGLAGRFSTADRIGPTADRIGPTGARGGGPPAADITRLANGSIDGRPAVGRTRPTADPTAYSQAAGSTRQTAYRSSPTDGRNGASQTADQTNPTADRFAPAPAPLAATVRVRLFDLLAHRSFQVSNPGPLPIPFGAGFLGPGASRDLQPGVPVGPGLLELRAPGLRRRLQGSVALRAGALVATVSLREYVAGVLAGELPRNRPELRQELGAAILRFLGRGPRHPGADVCDSTHCAYFIGRGPRLDWSSPESASILPEPLPELTDAAWAAIQERAASPGPDQWTGHCGGQPLSAHALWGGPDRRAQPCLRHPAAAAPWVRTWSPATVAKAFGAGIDRLELGADDGVWVLRIHQGDRLRSLRYDEVHRRLPRWDDLPSPASVIEAAAGGFRVRGYGAGHRVGLCLGE